MPMSDHLRSIRSKVGHELLVLPSAAVIIQDEQGRVLFGLHADKNTWVVPGGLIEPREFPSDAAVRETWEECGLIVEPTGVLGVFGGPTLVIHYPNGDVASYMAMVFRARVVGGVLKADGSEILEVQYLSRSEIENRKHAEWMDAAMDSIFTPTADPFFHPVTWRAPDE
jgi:8-oxo-dGTP pyrophosphatase MutT (NUDIX family)